MMIYFYLWENSILLQANKNICLLYMIKIIFILFLILIIFFNNQSVDHFVSFNPYTCRYFYDSHNKQYKPFMCDLFN